MSYTVVEEIGSDTSLIVEDTPLAPTIIEVVTVGPQGPVGPQGAGLGIDETVATLADLPATGSPGQTVFVAATGKIYIWSNT
jgi:hypothetical protein